MMALTGRKKKSLKEGDEGCRSGFHEEMGENLESPGGTGSRVKTTNATYDHGYGKPRKHSDKKTPGA